MQTESEHLPESLVGTRINDRYTLISLLGTGGTSRVYKAKDETENKSVAIKILNPQLVSSPVAVRRFNLEAKVLDNISHPGVIGCSDMALSKSVGPYLVLELAHGKSLKQLIEDTGPMPPQTAIGVFQLLCNALQQCHQLGVVHRGLSPEEIIIQNLDEMASVKIIDFGSARTKPLEDDDDQSKLETTNEVIGNPLYMSPEQRQHKSVDGRSDVYALGCVLYHALTGRVPFKGENLVELNRQHCTEAPPAMSDAWSVPNSLVQVVLKAMAKEPKDRFRSMSEMAQALGGRSTQQVKMLDKIGKKLQKPGDKNA